MRLLWGLCRWRFIFLPGSYFFFFHFGMLGKKNFLEKKEKKLFQIDS